MSEPHSASPSTHTSGHGSPNPLYFSREVDNTMTLIIVWVIVLGLSLVSVGLWSLGMGKFSLPIELAIGAVQAGIVAYFFMHLKQGDRVVILTALASVFWMGILFVLFLTDYMTRKTIVGW